MVVPGNSTSKGQGTVIGMDRADDLLAAGERSGARRLASLAPAVNARPYAR